MSDCKIVISFGSQSLSGGLLVIIIRSSELWLIGLYSSIQTVNADRLSSVHLVIGFCKIIMNTNFLENSNATQVSIYC